MCKLNINIIVIVISLFGLLGGCMASILQSGQCDTVDVDSEFEITPFAGRWIEVQRTGGVGEGTDCSTVDVIDGTTVTFNNSAVNNNFLVETSGSIAGNNGILTLSIDGTNTEVQINALLVNYDVFALMYRCENVDQTNRRVTIYLLQREGTTPTEMMYELMSTTLNNNFGLTVTDLKTVDHSEEACYQLPAITPGQPVILPGLCDPDITAVPNFQVTEFLGVWHEIGSYFSENALGTCARAQYSLGDDVVNVLNSQVINQTLFTIAGNASVVSTDESGHLKVLLDIAPGVVGEQDLWIINTDYNKFAVSYSCVDLPETNQRRVYSWILSRVPQLTSETQDLITETLRSYLDLNENYYMDTARSDDDCFYFPEPDGTPVVFRGQCDQSIPVMPNFNPTEYLGIWHNIESYPSQFISGSCVNAEYSLREDDAVDVLNSQVIGERLFTINGVAVVTNTSEPAKLTVTFPVEGTNETTSSGYWVLDTDYTTYSLVYTCIDLPNNERAVTSWKLGRSKTLNETVLALMDEIIDTIPVLDSRYYQEEDQTVDGCFYYPEPEAGQVVLFPGQCEDIDTAPNFNLTAFAGTWYELEAYPKDQQGGQCISHEYEDSGTNQLSLLSYQIVDQFQLVTSGVVTADSANSSRLTITISSGEEGYISIPFWIVSTDYENYALAYSCVNRNEDFRAVYSWKLSRTFSLSEAAKTAIDDAMASVNVLNNSYFEPIDQSLDACFYLPDLGPGEPVVLVGQCESDIPRVQNFLPGAYAGTWKLLSSYPSEFQTGTCNDATYTILGDGTVEVYNTQVINQALDTINGSAVTGTDDGSGLLLVTFPGSTEQSEYWILDTDYTSYSLVYSCININERERRIFSWILSRNETLSEDAINNINAVINNVTVLNNRFYEDIDRTAEGCFYFPEPNGNPVVFRGQCGQNITVTQDFNATAYLGLWHTIESYPSPSQLGTCNNAEYSLGDGVVNVFNTEVREQTLSTISGVAYISEDEPAKLLVQFPGVTNATMDYWVLATDYNSYSLVYSCANVYDEYRLVYSWKLSRSKELSASGVLAINAVTSGIQVLDDRYFVENDQSSEACFYYPDAIKGVPVIFPGQCNSNISVVSDFNITRFDGRWHEIESYPTGLPEGDCQNHIISTTTGNTWNVVSSSVRNLSLSTSNAVLSITSTTEPGKLTITFTSATGVVTLPLWVLDTDYENYALIYSCVDNDDDTRNVYSWKLGRSRTLPSEVATLIDNTIDAVDVLRNDFYWPVSQTDDTCFYLPVLQPGEPAIFPGQCDQNIPVVPNFDASRYLGRWRLISSYPSAFQDGTCNEAYYSLDDDGSIIVYNTQVIDQSLDSINGSAQVIGNGKLLVTFPDAPAPIEHWILDTDYYSYTLIYSCININEEQRQVWSWKMSRGNSLNETTLQAIDSIIETINVLDERYYYTIDRTEDDCFYFPDVTNDILIFRGQCDESISVVQEFNATAYQGIWYDIESYPQEFQFGTCPTARYTINDAGVVDVYNTQVSQQRLDSISGTAIPASDDGTGKLELTFVFPGFEIASPYWILDTDYEDYALVYSCVNINEDYYRVGSWKLSRSQTLSTAATANINTIMSSIRVLDQQYYLPWEHSEEACFYYPPLTDGRVILDGQCEDKIPNVVADFNVTGFAGSWYEIERFPSELQNGECTANRFEQTSATTFTLTKTIVYNERLQTYSGPASLASDGSGVLSVNLSNEDGSTINLNLYVLDTDYTSYALMYSCRNYDENSKQIFSWKLSMYQEGLTDAANEIIDRIVTENDDLFEDYYEVIGQDNDACFYYPEFDELPPVIELPGPCDESIVGVPNFDVNAYSGRWFETARYPDTNQLGACSRAHYTLNGTSVDVLNTEVADQLLRTEEGTAQIASNDSSGVLDVTFIINNEPVIARLYVLATDYTSYSLAYSCTNQPNGKRIVFSWKLSRERTLSAVGSNEIDRVIENTQGLSNEYFVPTSQTDEDCFYIPEVTENAPVFRQQCAAITGQENFDIEQFVGWWHEIESYPRDANAGDCISSNYQVVGNEINVVDTGVFDLTAQLTSGTVQADSNGRLLRVLDNGTTSFTQDVWVLATDYETYALLYSCENIDDEYRRVWSAKYSKARLTEFPESAETVMNATIAENQVLYHQFYQPTDQSDTACFHYPEQTGQQVILPGQCDENIPVEQNFNAVEYTGRWYQIERYAQMHESGNCTGAQYTLNEETSEVTVLNWEVIDRQLETIEGTAVVSSTDGSAKLMVSLPINGTDEMTTTSLYVLTTDYVSYSLAYSCVNINNFQRAVTAWKLSRTRSMPATANNAINAYMATREELHQPYFNQVGQSEDCEEPNSSAFIRSSIIVTLICLAIRMLV